MASLSGETYMRSIPPYLFFIVVFFSNDILNMFSLKNAVAPIELLMFFNLSVEIFFSVKRLALNFFNEYMLVLNFSQF